MRLFVSESLMQGLTILKLKRTHRKSNYFNKLRKGFSAIGYNKQNDRVQTLRVNSIFSEIALEADLKKMKNGESIHFDKFSTKMTSRDRCSPPKAAALLHFFEDIKSVLEYT